MKRDLFLKLIEDISKYEGEIQLIEDNYKEEYKDKLSSLYGNLSRAKTRLNKYISSVNLGGNI